jgi:hypothetical protein
LSKRFWNFLLKQELTDGQNDECSSSLLGMSEKKFCQNDISLKMTFCYGGFL